MLNFCHYKPWNKPWLLKCTRAEILYKPIYTEETPLTLYSWISLSRSRLSRITVYLEVKVLSLPKHENLITGENIVEKRRNWSLAISPLFHNIFTVSLTSRVQLHIYLLNVGVRILFSSILQIWYVEVRISRSISENTLGFEITRVDCILEESNFKCT